MKRAILSLIAAIVISPLASATSMAPAVRAEHAWIRLLPGDLPAAGYMVLENLTDKPQQLVSASSADFGQVMLHQSVRSSGVQHMQHVDSVVIPAHGTVAFKPGGYHLMLMQRDQNLKVGDTAVIVLKFADTADLSVGFQIRPANAEQERAMPASHRQ